MPAPSAPPSFPVIHCLIGVLRPRPISTAITGAETIDPNLPIMRTINFKLDDDGGRNGDVDEERLPPRRMSKRYSTTSVDMLVNSPFNPLADDVAADFSNPLLQINEA